MINLHSFRKSGSSISAMCSVVGKNPGGGGGGGVVKPTASLGPQEAKRLRRSDAEAERDPESDNGDLGSEGSSTKGDKGRHSIGSRTLAKLYQRFGGEDVLFLLPVVSCCPTDFCCYVAIAKFKLIYNEIMTSSLKRE